MGPWRNFGGQNRSGQLTAENILLYSRRFYQLLRTNSIEILPRPLPSSHLSPKLPKGNFYWFIGSYWLLVHRLVQAPRLDFGYTVEP
jgi:hypothetical protein